MDKKEELGMLIRTMRLSRKITQAELARMIGQSPSSITMYENGKREPDFETLEALADAFNVPMSALVPQSAEPPDTRPMSSRARILAYGFDKLPPEAQKRAEDMMELFFERYFDDTNGKDDPDARPEH